MVETMSVDPASVLHPLATRTLGICSQTADNEEGKTEC
jgi:hypothetical protein